MHPSCRQVNSSPTKIRFHDIKLMHYAYPATHRVLNEDSTVADFTRDISKALG